MAEYEIVGRGVEHGLPVILIARQAHRLVVHKLVRFGHRNPKYVWRETGVFFSRVNSAPDGIPLRFRDFPKPRYLSDSAIDNRLREMCAEGGR